MIRCRLTWSPSTASGRTRNKGRTVSLAPNRERAVFADRHAVQREHSAHPRAAASVRRMSIQCGVSYANPHAREDQVASTWRRASANSVGAPMNPPWSPGNIAGVLSSSSANAAEVLYVSRFPESAPMPITTRDGPAFSASMSGTYRVVPRSSWSKNLAASAGLVQWVRPAPARRSCPRARRRCRSRQST
jgi:hypothetical protein